MFIVNSMYCCLNNFSSLTSLGTERMKVLVWAWESLASSRIMVFLWKMILHRLPTKENLLRRRVFAVGIEPKCCWCSSEKETKDHLFVTT